MRQSDNIIKNNFDDIADKFYLPRIVEGSLRTEIAIHTAFHSHQAYAEDDIDKTWITFLNRGIYHRPFSRVTLLAKVQNAWYTIQEVSSMLHANEKTVRNIFAECRDLKMVDHKYEGNRLVIQSSQRGLDMYYRYVKSLYDVHNPMRKEYLKNIQEYQRLKKWKTYLEDPSTSMV
tara:strand:- start:633 stop:1157 length:525 start_codon:yes stop_codon:yes gene_type:complete